ncbi:MAG: hypothetical protein JWM70_133 [Microbacteriaceae bacterium]|nr:hypothetical protein [Microbacteriaceae bacterium]
MNDSGITKPRERGPRSFWFDPRFAIGIALVLVSVGGVLVIVSTADSSVAVVAARSALLPGDRIRSSDLATKRVRLGDLGPKYLVPADVPADGLVVTRAISSGELVPAAAVGSRTGLRVASVVVVSQGRLPKSVTEGSVVDLWSASAVDGGAFGPPTVLASSATVVRVLEPDGLVAGRDGGSVEVLIERAKIARVLEAISNEDAISLVPVSLPVND